MPAIVASRPTQILTRCWYQKGGLRPRGYRDCQLLRRGLVSGTVFSNRPRRKPGTLLPFRFRSLKQRPPGFLRAEDLAVAEREIASRPLQASSGPRESPRAASASPEALEVPPPR